MRLHSVVLPAPVEPDQRDDLTGGEPSRDAGEHGFVVVTRSPTSSSTTSSGPAGSGAAVAGRARPGAASTPSHPIVGDDRARQLFEEESDDAEREGEDAEERHGLDELARW